MPQNPIQPPAGAYPFVDFSRFDRARQIDVARQIDAARRAAAERGLTHPLNGKPTRTSDVAGQYARGVGDGAVDVATPIRDIAMGRVPHIERSVNDTLQGLGQDFGPELRAMARQRFGQAKGDAIGDAFDQFTAMRMAHPTTPAETWEDQHRPLVRDYLVHHLGPGWGEAAAEASDMVLGGDVAPPAMRRWLNVQPRTEAERMARTVGQMTPNALGPGGPLKALARVVLPAAASEGARYLTQKAGGNGSEQTLAQLLGGLAGGRASDWAARGGPRPAAEPAEAEATAPAAETVAEARPAPPAPTPPAPPPRTAEVIPLRRAPAHAPEPPDAEPSPGAETDAANDDAPARGPAARRWTPVIVPKDEAPPTVVHTLFEGPNWDDPRSYKPAAIPDDEFLDKVNARSAALADTPGRIRNFFDDEVQRLIHDPILESEDPDFDGYRWGDVAAANHDLAMEAKRFRGLDDGHELLADHFEGLRQDFLDMVDRYKARQAELADDDTLDPGPDMDNVTRLATPLTPTRQKENELLSLVSRAPKPGEEDYDKLREQLLALTRPGEGPAAPPPEPPPSADIVPFTPRPRAAADAAAGAPPPSADRVVTPLRRQAPPPDDDSAEVIPFPTPPDPGATIIPFRPRPAPPAPEPVAESPQQGPQQETASGEYAGADPGAYNALTGALAGRGLAAALAARVAKMGPLVKWLGRNALTSGVLAPPSSVTTQNPPQGQQGQQDDPNQR